MERKTVRGDGCGCNAGAVIVADFVRGEFVGVVRVAGCVVWCLLRFYRGCGFVDVAGEGV